MAYSVDDFSVDEVKVFLTAVKDEVGDTEDALEELIADLQQIRSHCTHLISQCVDRIDKLIEEEEDEEDDGDDHHDEA